MKNTLFLLVVIAFLSCSKDEAPVTNQSINNELTGIWDVTSYLGGLVGTEEKIGTDKFKEMTLSYTKTTDDVGDFIWTIKAIDSIGQLYDRVVYPGMYELSAEGSHIKHDPNDPYFIEIINNKLNLISDFRPPIKIEATKR